MRHILRRAAAFAAVWLALTGAAPGGLPFGAAAVALATWASLRLLPPRGRALRPLALLALLPHFLWESIKGGIDVARRALHPAMPLNAGWLRVPLTLPPGAARMSLGSEISLLPGTLAAGGEGDRLLVHCLDARAGMEARLCEEEARLARALRQEGEEGKGG